MIRKRSLLHDKSKIGKSFKSGSVHCGGRTGAFFTALRRLPAGAEKWEVIVKYHGDLKQLENDLITVEELIAGYAIVTLPETLIQSFPN